MVLDQLALACMGGCAIEDFVVVDGTGDFAFAWTEEEVAFATAFLSLLGGNEGRTARLSVMRAT
jgi:hypothetical protein